MDRLLESSNSKKFLNWFCAQDGEGHISSQVQGTSRLQNTRTERQEVWRDFESLLWQKKLPQRELDLQALEKLQNQQILLMGKTVQSLQPQGAIQSLTATTPTL